MNMKTNGSDVFADMIVVLAYGVWGYNADLIIQETGGNGNLMLPNRFLHLS